MRHNPKIEPKFHHAEMFTGAGKSISELFMILIKG
jgi:hypothetical protein